MLKRILPALLLVACGPASVKPRDVRVEVPAPDPAFLTLTTSDHVIEPGEDKMFCNEIVYDGEDMAFNVVETNQGKFGHHLIIMAADAPRGNGAVFDCSDMKSFSPIAVPTTGMNWPTGYGSFLQKGKSIVVQMHYHNTGKDPILVRDVIRLKKMPIASVTTWVSSLVLNNTNFSLEPKQASKLTFDSVVDKGYKLLMIAGHMHENGKSYKLEWGMNANAMSTLFEVTEWKAEYRDVPPVAMSFDNPKDLQAGTTLRTTCNWMNDSSSALKFPTEMCVTFALIAGSKDPVILNK